MRLRLTIALLLLFTATPLCAQQRPLKTQDVELIDPGHVLVEVGFDFLQDARFQLSGLRGDLTRIGVLGVNFGLGKMVELQIQGTVQNFLSVRDQVAAPVRPDLGLRSNSTRDFGDFTIATKIKLIPERGRRPAIGLRFAFEMPNSSQTKGIGLNTTNVFLGVLVQKHFGKLNAFANLGLGILQSPVAQFTQNDVFTYGVAVIYPVHKRINLVGEVHGRHSTRRITPALIGTESRSEARLGGQFFAGGFRWDLAAIIGLTGNAASTGVTFGVSKDLSLFEHVRLLH